MKTRNAITTALVLTGRYDHPTQHLTLKGRDAYNNEITETIVVLDRVALDRDVQAILDGRMSMPGPTISKVVPSVPQSE